MKNNKKIILGSIIAFTLFLAFTVVGVFGLADSVTAADTTAVTSSGGIVPCGTDATGPCTLCHLIIGIQKLFNFGILLVTTIAFVGIFIGGAMYMISAGDTSMMESAKKFITASMIGFALVFGAWLIVNIVLNIIPTKTDLGIGKTSWYSFTCSTTSSNTPSVNVGSEENREDTSTKVACGDGGRGTCITGGGYIDSCPYEYIPLKGGEDCKSEKISDGYTTCCIKESDTIKKDANGQDYYSCGAGGAGVCTNVFGVTCPDGWEWLSGGNDCSAKGIWNTATSMPICCTKE